MPNFGCDDQTLLAFCEQSQRLLVSLDRASMPMNVDAHVAAGAQTWGVPGTIVGLGWKQDEQEMVANWDHLSAHAIETPRRGRT
jgi:hypothetical protein